MRSAQNNPAYRAIGSREVSTVRRRGFTLVEVMVAIAISLALIIGVSEIFGIAQQTTGAGTALSAINDVQRSVQTTLTQDIRSMVTNDQESPGLVINSYAVPAFRNKADAQAGPDPQDPLLMPAPYTVPRPYYIPSQAFSVNDRVHRTDRMCFFVRGSYTRQTGESPNLSSQTKSGEAFIWLGHLALPNDSAISNWDWKKPADGSSGWFNPGATVGPTGDSGKNDNNLYASSWILGRCVSLLSPDPTLTTPPGRLTDSGFEFGTGAGTGGLPPLYLVSPTMASPATCVDGTSTFATLCADRYDMVYTPLSSWYKFIAATGSPRPSVNWWQFMSGTQLTGTSISFDQRYYGNPFPTKNPNVLPGEISNWISASVAQTAPIFVRGCSQFIVEFAGDYCAQNPIDGTPISGSGPDGQIDYILDPVTKNQRIRWYGFPRNTSGDPQNNLQPDFKLNALDVIPVSTFLGVTPLDFERNVPSVLPSTMSTGSLMDKMPFPTPAALNVPNCSEPYICAWGPDITSAKPKMIRITIGIDNPNGRLNTQQLFEYVFTLPS